MLGALGEEGQPPAEQRHGRVDGVLAVGRRNRVDRPSSRTKSMLARFGTRTCGASAYRAAGLAAAPRAPQPGSRYRSM